jgi:hypothetical protein
MYESGVLRVAHISAKRSSLFHEVVPYLSGRNASDNQTFNHISTVSIYNDCVQSVKSNKVVLHNIYESGVLTHIKKKRKKKILPLTKEGMPMAALIQANCGLNHLNN